MVFLLKECRETKTESRHGRHQAIAEPRPDGGLRPGGGCRDAKNMYQPGSPGLSSGLQGADT